MAIRTTTATANTTTSEAAKRPKWNALSTAAAGILLAAPALVLGIFGGVHFRDGLAVDAAVPVPVYMVAQISMSKAAYAAAAAALAQADPSNGGATLAAAEARWHAGGNPTQLIPVIRTGLMQEPASARGWTLLSEVLHPVDEKKAARALSQALVLAPREYWLIGARAKDAAMQWSALDPESRSMALYQARLLWQEPALHGQLRELLRFPEGAALVSRAFSQDDIRSINRWRARERIRNPSP
jgi:hypothetical protein